MGFIAICDPEQTQTESSDRPVTNTQYFQELFDAAILGN